MTTDKSSLRATWDRGVPTLKVDEAGLAELIASLFPGRGLDEATVLSGGLANTNMRLALDGPPGDVVLRLYQRDPRQMAKEAAIAARLDGKVPVARFLHVEPDAARLGAPFAVMSWIDGITLDTVLADLDDNDLARLGADLGRLLATIHGVTFETSGFFDGGLSVVQPIDVGGAGLVAFCRADLQDETVLARLGAPRAAGLQAFVDDHAGLLDAWTGPPCLTHSDFNGSNILVKPGRLPIEIAAVLDWEFALAGSPFFDLGNITRPPLGDNNTFTAGLERGYRKVDDQLPDNWRDLARLADLTAWVDFATRPELSDSVLKDVLNMIDRTIK